MAENYRNKSAVDLVRLLLKRGIELPEGATKPQIIELLKDYDENPSKYQKEDGPPAPPPEQDLQPEQAEQKEMTAADKLEARYKALPRKWVKVTQKGLGEGMDFSFTTDAEGCGHRTYHLINGAPVQITVKLIKHLIGCHHPLVKLQQGEAGTPVKVYGSNHHYAIESCDEPVKSQKVAAVSNVQ